MKIKSIVSSALVFTMLLLTSSRVFSQLTCIDSALSFNGNNQYLKLAPNDFSSNNFLKNLTGDYTIECLVKWNGGADFQRIFDFHFGQEYFMFLTTSESTNHVPRFAISATGLVNPQVLDAKMVLTPNVYHHIAITYSKVNSLLTMYIDGENVNSATITIAADSVYYGSDSHDSSANYIGLSPFDTDPTLNADIDEFRISDTVRYASDFTPQVTEFTPDAYTLALYHFNDGSGQQAADASGFNNTAELGSTADVDDNDPAWFSCAGVLATSFLNLSAANVQDRVQLSWSAASNSNIKSFEIQRSSDAAHFSTLSMQSAITTAGTHTYSYTDKTPLAGDNYYRVKMIDVSNNSSYSSLAHINMSGIFKIYPTIASQTLHVSVSKTPSTIVIFNSSGKPVKTFTISSGEQDVDVSSLAAGSYFVRNTTANTSLKFVKQ